MAVATKNGKASTNVRTNRIADVIGSDAPKKTVRVLRPVVRRIEVRIQACEGVPLVMNKFSEKAKQQMADKQQHLASGPRRAKDPEECYRGAMHLMPGGDAKDKKPDIGFQASGFRKAMINVAPQVGLKRPQVKGAVFVVADAGGLVRINYKTIRMREDTVRLESGVADLRYRPELLDWEATVAIEYDESLISAEQVVNLMHRAGFSNGIGEGRPEKNGDWGRWVVVADE